MSQTPGSLGPDPHAQQDGAAPQGLDLSAVRGRPPEAGQPGAAAAQGGPAGGALPDNAVEVPGLVFDVDEAQFEALVQLSAQVPVVIDLWAEWCGPCKQLSPVLERVVESYEGRVVLAKIDVDANPRIQQAFGVQSIPTVVALLAGQPAPLFQGAQPEAQVRQVLDQVVTVAAQQGMNRIAVPAGGAAPAEDPGPAHPEALAAVEAGDLARAEELYRAALAEAPADEDAKLGLARVELLKRTGDTDPAAAVAAADADPSSIDAALAAADAQLAAGDAEAAFSRLLALLPGAAAEDKERLRVRLLDLFEIVGPQDPRVVKARGRLMRALF
ncbi:MULTISPECIES: tetratricopeptide repeat protein [Brevibacterium]|uniref:Tetratricopeptide repeat protein n=1 Tax=Brevibacterium salitolerans TaxID=1403566 RepID=A0ABN2X5L9_9MICO|nr:tetratricopeptide repeat protein [Brevibacterium sp.]